MSINKKKLFVILLFAILLIAAISYFVFDVPLWVTLVGAVSGVFVSRLLTTFGKQ